jgi:hypothetical protein
MTGALWLFLPSCTVFYSPPGGLAAPPGSRAESAAAARCRLRHVHKVPLPPYEMRLPLLQEGSHAFLVILGLPR